MAPKPRPIKKKGTHIGQAPASTTPVEPGTFQHQTTKPSGTPASTRKTRASAAAAADNSASATPLTIATAGDLNVPGDNLQRPLDRKSEEHKQGQPDTANVDVPKKANARKRGVEADAATVPTATVKKPKKGSMGQVPAKAKKPRPVYIRGATIPAPPIEFASSEPPNAEELSSDEEVSLAVAATRTRGRQPGATQPQAAQIAEADDKPSSEAEAELESSQEDAAGTPDEDEDEDEDGGNESQSSDGLASDAETLGAQLAAEKPVWTTRRASTGRRNAPVRYEDIGGPRSEKGRKFRDLPIEESSPGLSDDDFEPDADSEEEENYESDDDEEKEWLQTIQKRAARDKASKALPLLLPPTTTHAAEQPVWKKPEKQNVASKSVPSKTLVMSAHPDILDISDDEGDDSEAASSRHTHTPAPASDGPDVLPPAAYAIVQPDGHGVVNLTAQHVHIRKTVRDTLPRLEAKLALENAFPDTITLAQDVHTALINVAADLGHTGLEQAFRLNHEVTNAISAIVRQRMSTYRGTIKKAADTHVAAYFQLKPGCATFVNALFDHLSYSYVFIWDPDQDRLAVSWNKPYGHKVYPALLHTVFFSGLSSLAARNAHRFPSSLDAKPEEKEIPIPMLAFVGTAIHAALTEWRTGTHSHVSFSADAFLDVYNEHKLLLNGIKTHNPRGFHTLMHRLYRQASGAGPINDAAVAAANSALAHVDFANMDMD